MTSDAILNIDSRIIVIKDGDKCNITDEARTMYNLQTDLLLHIFDAHNKKINEEINLVWLINTYTPKDSVYKYKEENILELCILFFNGYVVFVKWHDDPEMKFDVWVIDPHQNRVYLKDGIIPNMSYFDTLHSNKICDILAVCRYVSNEDNVEEMIREHKKILRKMWNEAVSVD